MSTIIEDIKPSRTRKTVEHELHEKRFVHDPQFRPKEHKPKVDHKRKPKNTREWQSWTAEGEDDE